MPDDSLRTSLRAVWSTAAPSWGCTPTTSTPAAAPSHGRDDRRRVPWSGDHVLELGRGPGGVGLAAAEVVGPDGHVVLSDIAAEMTALAQQRARGLSNVSVREIDLECIDSPGRFVRRRPVRRGADAC